MLIKFDLKEHDQHQLVLVLLWEQEQHRLYPPNAISVLLVVNTAASTSE